jgi:prepilin-type processing-associated H-X9-DG protein
MSFMRAVGRFLGPWFAHAVLQGIGAAMVFGAFPGIIGLFFLHDDPQGYAQFTLLTAFIGLVCGSLNGLLASLVGGQAGVWWSVISLTLVAYCVAPFPQLGGLAQFLPIGGLGAILTRDLLVRETPRYSWDVEIRKWLRSTWLPNPPVAARLIGIVLPLILCLGTDVLLTYPKFVENRSYVLRLGNWMTWDHSRSLARKAARHATHGQCQSNLKQIMLGVAQYVQDYDERYPPRPSSPSGGYGAILQPYLKSTQLFQCPAEFLLYTEGHFESGDFTDYWVNGRLYGKTAAQVNYSTKAVTWGDGNTGRGEANAAYALTSIPAGFVPASRHRQGANYAFADGHVKWFRSNTISNTRVPDGSTYTLVP